VGAGGTARAIAAALATAGSKVVLYGRTPAKTASAAKDLGVSARSLVELPGDAWDVLVQATPLGRDGEEVLPRRALRGKVVLDAVYREGGTPLVRDARAEGLAVVDGFDLLIAQAELQIEILTGCAVGSGRLEAALAAWRGERAAGSS
jgi:shikimate 5-dehydrogenase